MNRMEEQSQAVSQALENQEQHISVIETSQKHVEEQRKQIKDHVKEIVREELRKLVAGEPSLTAVASAFQDRHSGAVAKPYSYDGKTSFIMCSSKTSHARTTGRMKKRLAC
nr:unnamed protein product [Callosobruchus chinensis]CAH7753236.1 unnamed protein product [Callosobruchus chinensis]